MRPFRDLPIRRKLTVVNALISGVALALACAAFAVHEQGTFRRQMERDFAILAEMFGANVASGLAFDDPESMVHTLASLQAHPRIAAACVYDANGRVMARYVRPEVAEGGELPVASGTAQRFTGERLETFHTIELAGEEIGTLYLGADLEELHARVWRYVALVSALLVGCSLVALGLAARLQRTISEPIAELAHTASVVANGRDYTVRARKRGEDETGRLIDTFNGMLDQIQARDAALQEARDQLERRVELRTKELGKSLSLLGATLESTTDGIMAVDLDGNVVVTNTKLATMWRMPAELLARRNRQELVEHKAGQTVDPEEFRRVTAERDATPDLVSFDVIALADGRVIERYRHPQRIDGRTVGVVSSFRDVTERKQAEAQLAHERDLLRVLLEASPDTIFFKDRESRFVRVSKSETLRHLGRQWALKRGWIPEAARGEPMQPADTNYLIGSTTVEVLGPELGGKIEAVERTIMRTGEPVLGQVDRYVSPDGRVHWGLYDQMPWRDPAGMIVGTFGVSKDITALKEAEERLAEVHRQLLETSRRAGMAEVATGVLHNVGNVLNSVNVSTTILAEQVRQSKMSHVGKLRELLRPHEGNLAAFFSGDARGQQLPEFLEALATHLDREQETLLTELDQLRKNVAHIKDIVAMQQNYAKVSGVTERVAITDLVEDALRMSSGAFARHDVTLMKDYQGSPKVVVEKHKVLQILINLLRNAKYACDDAGRSEKCITVRVETAEGRVRIEVSDNGVGIAPENLTRIFGHGFTTRKHGHGFGLHSGALAARELGGTLQARSEGPGRGATFTLEIPLNEETQPA
jgi:PAS domain S-box